eukprot:11192044-Lingulodinium_polyedra.AAC.1
MQRPVEGAQRCTPYSFGYVLDRIVGWRRPPVRSARRRGRPPCAESELGSDEGVGRARCSAACVTSSNRRALDLDSVC